MEKVIIPKKYQFYIDKIYKDNNIIESTYANYTVAEKIAQHYLDAQKFNASDELIYFLIYQSVRYGYYNIKPVSPKHVYKYIDEIFNNNIIKERILHSDCKSEFYTVIKDMIPFYDRFTTLIKEKQYYSALKEYKKILDTLNLETLNLYPEELLDSECKKRYPEKYYTPKYYKNRINNKKYIKEPEFNLLTLPTMRNDSFTCELLISYFHQKMLELYSKTDYIYKPIDNDYSFYKIGKLNIIVYNYDDLINLNLNHLNHNYSMKKAEFWGILYNDEIKDNYRLPMKFKKMLNIYKPCIIVPDGYIDEALVDYLTKKEGYDINNMFLQEKLKKLGFSLDDYEDKEGLISIEGMYFKDPKLVETLKIRNLDNYKTLSKILQKPKDKRPSYFKSLTSYYKGVVRKITEEKEHIKKYTPKTKKEKRDWYSK